MLVPFLCVLNLIKCYFFGSLKLRSFQGLTECNYFLGVIEINLHHFYGVVQFGGENWRTKNEIIFGGPNIVLLYFGD